MTLPFHPLADIFPLIEGEEFDALVADIREHGLREPVILHDGKILDGRSRYLACLEAGVDCRFETYEGDDPAAYVVSLNLKRRHLSESQRAMVAAKLATLDLGANQHSEGTSIEEASRLLNVGHASVERARTVQRDGAPELQRAVERGDVSVSTAAYVATCPIEEQREIVARGEKEIIAVARAIYHRRADKRRAEQWEMQERLSKRNAPLPDRRYPILYADPPWKHDFGETHYRAVQRHYPVMALEEICALKVADLTTPDAMLFLWVPAPLIVKGGIVAEAWGFALATSAVWVKDKIGPGHYFRQQHEILLLARRGNPITPAPGDKPSSVIHAPRREHSRKPDEVYAIIERMYPGLPKIELFARRAREGWAAWGNQAEAAA
jgi:N6-adenosine-specific RNA methylase IME4/ParB-like chromosome segregation protein Spo0J